MHQPTLTDSDPQAERFRSMTPAEKLRATSLLFWSAYRLKEASLRAFHPELSDEEIRAQVKAFFLYARD
jgi:hypothetical protein